MTDLDIMCLLALLNDGMSSWEAVPHLNGHGGADLFLLRMSPFLRASDKSPPKAQRAQNRTAPRVLLALVVDNN
jgi:hypothetical protein